MAYAWIKVHANLKRHPRVIALSDLLADDLAFAYLISLWSWTCEFAPKGRITTPNPSRLIERECGWRGEPGRLYRLLVSERWLAPQSETEIIVGGWDEYQRPHIEKAEKEAERLRNYRAKTKAENQDTCSRTRTETGTDDERTAYGTESRTHDVREKRRGEENRKEENKNLALFDSRKDAGADRGTDDSVSAVVCTPRRRGRPPKDRSGEGAVSQDAEREQERNDADRWIEKARALIGLSAEEAPWSKQAFMAFRRARKQRGADQLMRALDGLEGDQWASRQGLITLLSSALIEKGLASAGKKAIYMGTGINEMWKGIAD